MVHTVLDLDFTDGACTVLNSAETSAALRAAGLRLQLSRAHSTNSTHVEVLPLAPDTDDGVGGDVAVPRVATLVHRPLTVERSVTVDLAAVRIVWCSGDANAALCALRLTGVSAALRKAGDAWSMRAGAQTVVVTDEAARRVCGYGGHPGALGSARPPPPDVWITAALVDTCDGLRRLSSVEVTSAVLVAAVSDQLLVALATPLLEERERLQTSQKQQLQQKNQAQQHTRATAAGSSSQGAALVEPSTVLYLRLQALAQARAVFTASATGASSTPILVVDRFTIAPVTANISLSRVNPDGPDLFRQIVGGYAVMIPTAMKHTEVTLPRLLVAGGRVETAASLTGRVVQWAVGGMGKQWGKFTAFGNFVDRIGGTGPPPPPPPPFTEL